MNTAFRTTYTNKFSGKEVDLKLGALLNAAGTDAFKKDLDGSIVHDVQVGANYLNINTGKRSTTVGDWNLVMALSNVMTDDLLGLIHAKDIGFHVSGNLANLPAYKEGIGVVMAGYQGEYADLVHGLDKIAPTEVNASADPLRAALDGVRYFALDLKNGGLYVGKLLIKKDAVGDPRLQPKAEKIVNSVLYRQQAIDLLMSDTTVHCIWPDYRQNYMNVKWTQFNMDVATLAQDKRERILSKIGKTATATAYGVIAQAAEEAAQIFEQTGVEQPIEVPANRKTTVCTILDASGVAQICDIADLACGEYQKVMGGLVQRSTLTLGDDIISRTMLAILAKQGMSFRLTVQA